LELTWLWCFNNPLLPPQSRVPTDTLRERAAIVVSNNCSII